MGGKRRAKDGGEGGSGRGPGRPPKAAIHDRDDSMAGLAVDRTVVIDNGGCTLKVGFAGEELTCVLSNFIAKPKADKKTYFGDQINHIKDISSISLRRPVDRGFVTNWPVQKDIWAHVFRNILKINPIYCSLLITEAPFALPSLQGAMDDVLFGEFKFKRVLVMPAAALSVHHILSAVPALPVDVVKARSGVVIDAGFSFTHVSPVFDGDVLASGVRRIDLGGKALTNYLKELVSFRAFNMMDEYLIIEDVKEQLTFVSQDLKADLEMARKPPTQNLLRREYVLPDGLNHTRGYVKEFDLATVQAPKKRKADDSNNQDEEQIVPLANERFMVPETLFHPSDIGVNQMGIAEALVHAVNATPASLHPLMYSNVVITGGSANIPGFVERLRLELRPLVPEIFELHLRVGDPVTTAWRGGASLAASAEFVAKAVTRETYHREGNRAHQQGHRSAWEPKSR